MEIDRPRPRLVYVYRSDTDRLIWRDQEQERSRHSFIVACGVMVTVGIAVLLWLLQ